MCRRIESRELRAIEFSSHFNGPEAIWIINRFSNSSNEPVLAPKRLRFAADLARTSLG